MTANSRSASRSVSELVGSSKTITRAFETRARATSTSCCAPTLSVARDRLGPDVGMLEQVQRLGRRAGGARRAGPAPPGPLLAEHDVGLDRQVRGDRQLLVDHRHAARRAPRAGLAGRRARRPSVIVPAVGPIGAAQDLHQRALAGAVLADQGVDLARLQRRARPRRAPGSRRTTWRRRASQQSAVALMARCASIPGPSRARSMPERARLVRAEDPVDLAADTA